MIYNNTVILTGNIGNEIEKISGSSEFIAFRLATADRYKDEEAGEWKDKETIWHDVLAFSPKLIERSKELKKGDRVTVTGTLSYKGRGVVQDGKTFEINEARVVARKIEPAPLD